MAMGNKIRVGLIGAGVQAGWGGSVHAKAIEALPDFELTAVATAHRETADQAARAFNAEFAFDDYRELIACPDVDVVAVVVRVPHHHQMTLAALDAGKHVFCEWPLGANLAEAEEMAERARASGLQHMVGLQGRAEPMYVTLQRLVGDGYVGDVLACRITAISGGVLEREERRSWQVDPALGAHTLSIPAGHALDSFRFAVGEFAELSGQLSTQVPEWRVRETSEMVHTSSPDTVLLQGVLQQGAAVSAHIAAVPFHGGGSSIEIYGTEGTLVLNGARHVQTGDAVLLGAHGGDAELAPIAIEDHDAPPESIRATPAGNVARLYTRMGTAIRDDAALHPDFDTAVELHRLLDAISRSSDQGARVVVR